MEQVAVMAKFGMRQGKVSLGTFSHFGLCLFKLKWPSPHQTRFTWDENLFIVNLGFSSLAWSCWFRMVTFGGFQTLPTYRLTSHGFTLPFKDSRHAWFCYFYARLWLSWAWVQNVVLRLKLVDS